MFPLPHIYHIQTTTQNWWYPLDFSLLTELKSLLNKLDNLEFQNQQNLKWKVVLEGTFYAMSLEYENQRVSIIFEQSYWKFGHFQMHEWISKLFETVNLDNFITQIHSCDYKPFTPNESLSQSISLILPHLKPKAQKLVAVECRQERAEFRYFPMDLGLIQEEFVKVVGCVGTMREGKSTLMNLFLRYHVQGKSLRPEDIGNALDTTATNDTTSPNDTESDFFSTSNGHESHTMGMTAGLFPHNNSWILLVDFEGFEDPQKDDSYDQYLFTLAISTVGTIICNQRGSGIKAPTLDFLASMCENTKYMLGEKMTCDWLVLFRDFTLDRIDALTYNERIINESPIKNMVSSIQVHFCAPPPETIQLSKKYIDCPFFNDLQYFFDCLMDTISNQRLKTMEATELVIQRVCRIMSDNFEKGERLLHSHLESICLHWSAVLAKEFEETEFELNTESIVCEQMNVKESILLQKFKELVSESIPDYPNTKLRNAIKRLKAVKLNQNRYKATDLAKRIRDKVEQFKPPQKEYTFPHGTIDRFDDWVTCSVILLKRYVKGPTTIAETCIQDFKQDTSIPRNFVLKYNTEQTKRVAKERKKRETRLENAKEEQDWIHEFYKKSSSSDKQVLERMKELEFKVRISNQKIQTQNERLEEKTTEMDELVREYEDKLVEIQRENRERLQLRLDEKTREHEREVNDLMEQIKELEKTIEVGKKTVKSASSCKVQ